MKAEDMQDQLGNPCLSDVGDTCDFCNLICPNILGGEDGDSDTLRST